MNTLTIRYNGDVIPCCYDLTSKLVMCGKLFKDRDWNKYGIQVNIKLCEIVFMKGNLRFMQQL